MNIQKFCKCCGLEIKEDDVIFNNLLKRFMHLFKFKKMHEPFQQVVEYNIIFFNLNTTPFTKFLNIHTITPSSNILYISVFSVSVGVFEKLMFGLLHLMKPLHVDIFFTLYCGRPM